jgi:predicted nucleic-acid-binding Zn-ribbon protein
MKVAPCPNCESRRLYESKGITAGGGNAPNYLPGLGGTFSAEKFNLVICADCGLAPARM